MKAESILQSHLLDIIFENRNKEYGAYPLRMYYAKRLYWSIAVTLTIVTLFSVFFSMSKQHVSLVDPNWKLDSVILSPPPVETVAAPPKEVKPPIVQVATSLATFQQDNYTAPDIVKDNLVTKAMINVDKLDSSVIGVKTIEGKPITNEVVAINEAKKGPAQVVSNNNTGMDDGPLSIEFVEKMPEFPGGKAGLMKYLLRNITQPNDLEESDKIVVIASFVVNRLGDIEKIEITKNGRKDLDDNVVQVIRKMPRWKPGFQNGRNVSVYYSLPITFVPGDTN